MFGSISLTQTSGALAVQLNTGLIIKLFIIAHNTNILEQCNTVDGSTVSNQLPQSPGGTTYQII